MKTSIILSKSSIVSVLYRPTPILIIDANKVTSDDIIRIVCDDFENNREKRIIPLGYIITPSNAHIFKKYSYQDFVDYFLIYFQYNFSSLPQ